MNVLASMNIMESEYTALPDSDKILFLRVSLKFTRPRAVAKAFGSGAAPCWATSLPGVAWLRWRDVFGRLQTAFPDKVVDHQHN